MIAITIIGWLLAVAIYVLGAMPKGVAKTADWRWPIDALRNWFPSSRL